MHGLDINKMQREATIKVDESTTLKQAGCKNIAELPTELQKKVMEAWFDSCASAATLMDTEGMENATIRRHKLAVFLDQAGPPLATTSTVNFITVSPE